MSNFNEIIKNLETNTDKILEIGTHQMSFNALVSMDTDALELVKCANEIKISLYKWLEADALWRQNMEEKLKEIERKIQRKD